MTDPQAIGAYVSKRLAVAPPAHQPMSRILPTGLTDQNAVIGWLKTSFARRGQLADTTLANYVTEARRLFWYARWVDRPLTEWTQVDAYEYLAFLKEPDPTACGLREGNGQEISAQRTDSYRTSFRCGLSDASARQSTVIASSLFKWLVTMHYLAANPFPRDLLSKRNGSLKKQTRFVDGERLELVRAAIAGRECISDRQRAKQARDLFILDLFTKTGLQVSEAIEATMGAIRYARFTSEQRARTPGCPQGVWVIDVKTTDTRPGRTVSCAAIMGSLQKYRVAYGLPPLPACNEEIPMILGSRRRPSVLNEALIDIQQSALRLDPRPIEAVGNRSSLYRLVKSFMTEALAWRETRNPLEGEQLRKASTHWLRHSYAMSLIAADADLVTVSRNLGLEGVTGALAYIKDEDVAQILSAQRLLAPPSVTDSSR